MLEYVPDTVYRINKHYTKNEQVCAADAAQREIWLSCHARRQLCQRGRAAPPIMPRE